MALDGLAREEERLRDLGIARPAGDEAGDLALALTERPVLHTTGAPAPGPHPEPPQLLLRDPTQGGRAEVVCPHRGCSQLGRRAPAIQAREGSAEVDAKPELVETARELCRERASSLQERNSLGFLPRSREERPSSRQPQRRQGIVRPPRLDQHQLCGGGFSETDPGKGRDCGEPELVGAARAARGGRVRMRELDQGGDARRRLGPRSAGEKLRCRLPAPQAVVRIELGRDMGCETRQTGLLAAGLERDEVQHAADVRADSRHVADAGGELGRRRCDALSLPQVAKVVEALRQPKACVDALQRQHAAFCELCRRPEGGDPFGHGPGDALGKTAGDERVRAGVVGLALLVQAVCEP